MSNLFSTTTTMVWFLIENIWDYFLDLTELKCA